MVYCGELVIDYVKHAFVAKFNRHETDVYTCYSAILSKDVTSHRYEQTTMDPTHTVVNRIGIGMLPLACVVFRVLGKQLTESQFQPFTLAGFIFVLLSFGILVAFVSTS